LQNLSDGNRRAGYDHVGLSCDEIGRLRLNTLWIGPQPADIDADVVVFPPAEVLQRQPKRSNTGSHFRAFRTPR
jgi:hypothetical protein